MTPCVCKFPELKQLGGELFCVNCKSYYFEEATEHIRYRKEKFSSKQEKIISNLKKYMGESEY